jgi:putative FmdB family regulatory protein
MPLYEYRCSKCDKKIEVIRKFSDPPLTEHEDCGGTLEQLLSAPAFQLKGTGWYVTDYGKGGVKPSADAGSKAGDSKDSEAKASSSKDGDGGSGEKKTGEKSGETKSSQANSDQTKSGQTKSGQTKSSQTKSNDSKSDSKAESKPAATTKAD